MDTEGALLPPGPLDVYRIESGLFGGSHLGLLRNWRLYGFIAGQLDPLAGAGRAVGDEAAALAAGPASVLAEGGGAVRPSAPVLIPVRLRGDRLPEVVAVEVRPEGEPSPEQRLQGFLAVARGGVVRRLEPLGAPGPDGVLRGTVDLRALDGHWDRVYLGVRLVPRRGGRPSLARLRADLPQGFRFSLAAGAGQAQAAGPGGPAGRPAEAGGRDPVPRGGAVPAPPEVTVRDRNDRGVPRIDVVYRNKRTTDRVEERTYHVRWEWDFGDGTTWVDDDPSHLVSRVEHAFPPGRYTVRARSWSNRGTVLREITWDVAVAPPGPTPGGAFGPAPGGAPPDLTPGGPFDPPPGGGLGPGEGLAVRAFRAETVREPVPRLVLRGLLKWITGRPARFRLEVEVPTVPFLESVQVTCYPARAFDVVWARPGIFRVQAATVVRLTYRLPEGWLVLVNTYVVERQVDVLATSVTE